MGIAGIREICTGMGGVWNQTSNVCNFAGSGGNNLPIPSPTPSGTSCANDPTTGTPVKQVNSTITNSSACYAAGGTWQFDFTNINQGICLTAIPYESGMIKAANADSWTSGGCIGHQCQNGKWVCIGTISGPPPGG